MERVSCPAPASNTFHFFGEKKNAIFGGSGDAPRKWPARTRRSMPSRPLGKGHSRLICGTVSPGAEKHAAGEERARAGAGRAGMSPPSRGRRTGRGAKSAGAPVRAPVTGRAPGRGRWGGGPRAPERGAGRRDPPAPRARLRGAAPTPGPRRPRRRQLLLGERGGGGAAGKTRAGAGAERAGAWPPEVGGAERVSWRRPVDSAGGSPPGIAHGGLRAEVPGEPAREKPRSGLGATPPVRAQPVLQLEALYPTQHLWKSHIFQAFAEERLPLNPEGNVRPFHGRK